MQNKWPPRPDTKSTHDIIFRRSRSDCVQPGQRSLRPWQPGDRGAPATGNIPRHQGGSLMATKKCPHLATGKDGRWLKFFCHSPAPCPENGCPANPCYQEPDPDGAGE